MLPEPFLAFGHDSDWLERLEPRRLVVVRWRQCEASRVVCVVVFQSFFRCQLVRLKHLEKKLIPGGCILTTFVGGHHRPPSCGPPLPPLTAGVGFRLCDADVTGYRQCGCTGLLSTSSSVRIFSRPRSARWAHCGQSVLGSVGSECLFRVRWSTGRPIGAGKANGAVPLRLGSGGKHSRRLARGSFIISCPPSWQPTCGADDIGVLLVATIGCAHL